MTNVLLFVGFLTSQKHPSVSQRRVCSDELTTGQRGGMTRACRIRWKYERLIYLGTTVAPPPLHLIGLVIIWKRFHEDSIVRETFYSFEKKGHAHFKLYDHSLSCLRVIYGFGFLVEHDGPKYCYDFCIVQTLSRVRSRWHLDVTLFHHPA